MDILKLAPETYLPIDIIEGFSSKIWTERYIDPGEVELHTGDIERIRNLLPKGTFISLRDTREVVIIDNLEIKKSKGSSELVLKGKTFDYFMNQRNLDFNNANYPEDHVGVGMATGKWDEVAVDVINNAMYTTTDHGGDQVPNFSAMTSVDFGMVPKPTEDIDSGVDKGGLYPYILNILNKKNYGIRTLRPLDETEKLRLDIYNSKYPKIVSFRYDLGDFPDPSYIDTNREYKNVALVECPLGRRVVYAPGWDNTTARGLDRRMMYVDASDVTSIASGDTLTDRLTRRGIRELAKFNRTQFFSGQISPLTEYKYKVDYDLGHKIDIQADYGIKQTLMVSEFIRTEDSNGDRGFPTLVEVS